MWCKLDQQEISTDDLEWNDEYGWLHRSRAGLHTLQGTKLDDVKLTPNPPTIGPQLTDDPVAEQAGRDDR